MRLNGWQRIFCVFLIPFWVYLAIMLHGNLVKADEVIERLSYEVKRLQLIPEDEFRSSFFNNSREHALGFSLDRLKRAEDGKVYVVVETAMMAFLLPVIVYLIVAWIVAGFRNKPNA